MVMGELAELPPPPPEPHPAATPTTRTALAAAPPTTRRRRERSEGRARTACGLRKNRRAKANRGSSIKAPFGFGQDCVPVPPFPYPAHRLEAATDQHHQVKRLMQDVYRTLNNASTVGAQIRSCDRSGDHPDTQSSVTTVTCVIDMTRERKPGTGARLAAGCSPRVG